MDKSEKSKAGINGSILVNQDKSSRLREMREKAMTVEQFPRLTTQAQGYAPGGESVNLSPELLLARQLIDSRLAEILASLPAGMQRSLFKIRYGVELDRLRNLPIKRILSVLKISHPSLNNPSAGMKRIGDLNYNGGQAVDPAA